MTGAERQVPAPAPVAGPPAPRPLDDETAETTTTSTTAPPAGTTLPPETTVPA